MARTCHGRPGKLLRLGQSHVIQRCDGKGPVVTFSEGLNFFSNRIRKWLQINQAVSYKIYIDDTLVAVAEETQQGFQSITFRAVEDSGARSLRRATNSKGERNGGKHRLVVAASIEELIMVAVRIFRIDS
eukprot:Skav216169  [mRNA]  locus=scaffold1043:245075:249464:+ [translate_table: standard]